MATLKELRIQRVMSQADLSRASGVTVAAICRLERGQRKPQFVTIRKLAKGLNVDPNEIEFNFAQRI
ncbi:helix-turn-helix transcriptional regulator [Candidatus Dehalogenimonas loeffleri]|uniref:Helix-turn-helix transcriptional regulator n=1 Tax=Candidatus Dehalogenimonas loeffleri TaxID=3127115 RepID=A0ABZ2J789_9CHLR